MSFSFSTLFSVLALIYINDPVVNMRETPDPKAEVVSQARFAEEISLQNVQGNWSLIMTPDGYIGWTPSQGLVFVDQTYAPSLKTSRLMTHLYETMDVIYGPLKTLPFGSPLQLVEQMNDRWLKIALPDGSQCFVQTGDVASDSKFTTREDLVAFSKRFLGLPYTWGGRSSFGFDCSGFVQMLYSQIGIHLQRDARQQILDPRFEDVAIEDLAPGDILFFGKTEHKIHHVGMFIGNGQFIHSTVSENQPWIRISNLTDFEWSACSPSATYPYRTARRMLSDEKPILTD